jgi:hypothetical protein
LGTTPVSFPSLSFSMRQKKLAMKFLKGTVQRDVSG